MGRIVAAILIGGLRRSDFELALGFRLASLPLEVDLTLLRAWTERLVAAGASEVRIITDDSSDAQLVRESDFLRGRFAGTEIRLQRETASHRGTAGTLRDGCSDLSDGDRVIWIEPHCLPPVDLRPLFERAEAGDVAIGISGLDHPAGACLVPAGVLRTVSRIGYQDFKEQFLPALATLGVRVLPVPISHRAVRVHSRTSYLEAVATWAAGPRISPKAEVHPTARIDGHSIIADGARIGAEAVVLDGIILENAAVGEGAVVARSVVPMSRRVAPRSLVVDRVIDIESSDATDELIAVPRVRPSGATR
jgi:carbonic anhydrase/acetyltransferase-like protein (isoleucine patch superfamily)